MESATESPSSRRVKFAELASKRVNRATAAIGSIGNLSNRTNYEWTEQDAKKILRELRKAVREIEDRFFNKGSRSGRTFSIEP